MPHAKLPPSEAELSALEREIRHEQQMLARDVHERLDDVRVAWSRLYDHKARELNHVLADRDRDRGILHAALRGEPEDRGEDAAAGVQAMRAGKLIRRLKRRIASLESLLESIGGDAELADRMEAEAQCA